MKYRVPGLAAVMTLLVGSSLCVAASTPAGSRGVSRPSASDDTTLYLLTYDHGGLVLWGRDHFVKYLRSAAQWLERYPDFEIGLDNEAYTYDRLAEEDPAVLDEIRTYLKRYKGRFGIGTCTYGQPLSVFINEESNIRQMEYALAADRKYFDYAPPVYLMSEHALHAQLPQILRSFGFQGAVMRTHFMMYGYNPTFDVPLGWWVGLDGSRLAAVPTYRGEGAEFGKTTVDNWILTRYPSLEARKSPADFRQEFSRIRPLLASRADDAGLRREELVKEYADKPGYRWILLDELFSLFPAPRAELRTSANDFVVRMPWGYCGNEIWNQSRAAEVAVLTAERTAALAVLAGMASRAGDLDRAWKNLLVAQHHDIQICGLLTEARQFLGESLRLSQNVTRECLERMASCLATGDFHKLVIFNPLSWRRQAWLELPIALPKGYAKDLQVYRAGKVVPAAVLAPDSYSDGSIRAARLAVLAELDGLTVGAFELRPAPINAGVSEPPGIMQVDSANRALMTPFWNVRFDADGGLASLKDIRTGQEFLRPGGQGAFFAGRIDDQDVRSKGRWVLEAPRDSQTWAVARENGRLGAIPYTLEMKFYRENRRIDCSMRFHFAGQKIGRVTSDQRDSVSAFVHEDKLRLKLFPALHGYVAGVRDLPFAVSATADSYINGLYWTAVTDGAQGIAVFNKGTMGAVREKDGGFSVPLAYASFYVWGTRMLSGDFEYELALYPFEGPWAKADLQRHALEYNFPLAGIAAPPSRGDLGATFQPIRFESDNALVSALYERDGRTYVRMYEFRGAGGPATLRYTQGRARVTQVDLADHEAGELPEAFSLKPWEIKTVKVEHSTE
jgi:alpha-mannosidase